MSIAPAAARRQRLDQLDMLRRVHARELLERRARRLDALPAEPVVARHLGLERARSARAARGGPGCRGRGRRRGGTRAARTTGTVPAVQEPPSDLVVVGAGAAGLFASLTAARRGRPRHARLRAAAGRDRLLLGAGRARGRARRRRLAGPAPRGHGRRRTRARPALGRRGAVRRRRRRGSPTSRRSASASTPTATATWRSASRAATASAASCTPAAARRAGGSCASSPPTSSRRSGSRCSRAGASARCSRTATAASTGVACDDGRAVAARAVILASGGAAALWSRTTNPPGSYGSGLLLARAAGAELADLEFAQFHPTAVVGIRGREGFLISEAVRGEGATLHDAAGERFVDELQPRDAVARAIHRLLARDGRARRVPRHDRDRPRALPERRRRAARGRPRPGDRARPGLPRQPLRDGRRSTSDLDGRSSGRRPLRRRRVRLHGPARREPARVELAVGVLRVRAPGRARRARRARSRPAWPPPPERDLAPPPSRATRAAMWRDAGLERDADGLRRLLDDPHPLARLVAASALAREESRGAHARADFPATDPGLDDRHSVVAAGRRDDRLRQVDVSVRRLTSTQHSLRLGLHVARANLPAQRSHGTLRFTRSVGLLEPKPRGIVHVPDQPLHLPGARG